MIAIVRSEHVRNVFTKNIVLFANFYLDVKLGGS
jgi:hypothetical protein